MSVMAHREFYPHSVAIVIQLVSNSRNLKDMAIITYHNNSAYLDKNMNLTQFEL